MTLLESNGVLCSSSYRNITEPSHIYSNVLKFFFAFELLESSQKCFLFFPLFIVVPFLYIRL